MSGTENIGCRQGAAFPLRAAAHSSGAQSARPTVQPYLRKIFRQMLWRGSPRRSIESAHCLRGPDGFDDFRRDRTLRKSRSVARKPTVADITQFTERLKAGRISTACNGKRTRP